MPLETFDDLLLLARAQPEPQRLLLVFAAAELPPDATAAQRQSYAHGEGGTLTPQVCVDKRPEEIASFAALAQESRATGMDWQMLFVAALPGRGGHAPNSDEAVQPLRLMVEQIRGGHIAHFLTVAGDGRLVQLRCD